jgi:prepilin-type processing-associated H-X9-DG protein
MKQILLATTQYIQDFDERFPGFYIYDTAGGAPAPVPTGIFWYQGLEPYTKNMQIFICPSRAKDFGWSYSAKFAGYYDPDNASWDNHPVAYAINYGQNSYDGAVSYSFSSTYGPPRHLSVMNNPAELFLYGERGAGNAPGVTNDGSACGDMGSPHFDGANLGFVDGHVKWLAFNKICDNYLSTNNRLWDYNAP